MKSSVKMLGAFTAARSWVSWLRLVRVALYLWQTLSSLVGNRAQFAQAEVPLPGEGSEAFPQTCSSADLRKLLWKDSSDCRTLPQEKFCSYLFSRDFKRAFKEFKTCQTCFMLFELFIGPSLLFFTVYSVSLLLKSTCHLKE